MPANDSNTLELIIQSLDSLGDRVLQIDSKVGEVSDEVKTLIKLQERQTASEQRLDRMQKVLDEQSDVIDTLKTEAEQWRSFKKALAWVLGIAGTVVGAWISKKLGWL